MRETTLSYVLPKRGAGYALSTLGGWGSGYHIGKMPAEQFLYYAAFLLFLVANGIGWTTAGVSGEPLVSAVKLGLQLLVLALLALKLLFQLQKPTGASSAVTALVLLALCLASARVSDDLTLTWLLVFVIAGRDVRLRTLAKVALLSYSFVLAFTLLGCAAGLLENVCLTRGGEHGLRQSFGFNHPNRLGTIFFEMGLAFFFVRFPDYHVADFAFLAACAAAALAIPNSRTALIGLLAVLACMAVLNACKRRAALDTRPWMRAVVVAVALCVMTSFYFMVFYSSSNPVHVALNSALSGRLYYAHYYFVNYAPALLGQSFDGVVTSHVAGQVTYLTNTLVLDNAYSHLFEVHGYLLTAVFVGAWLALLTRLAKDGRADALFLGLAILAFYGFSEATVIGFAENYALVGFSALLYGVDGSGIILADSEEGVD